MPESQVTEWQKYLETVLRLSPRTIVEYVNDVLQYVSFLEFNHFEINDDSVTRYMGVLADQKLKASSQSRKLTSIRMFAKWQKILISVRGPKLPRNLPKPMKHGEIDILIVEAERDNSAVGRQAVAIFELAYGSGLRASELISATMDDLELSEKMLRIRGKGSKDRYVPLTDRCVDALRKWIPIRVKVDKGSTIFVAPGGGRLDRSIISRQVEKYARRAGLKVSPHQLRHTCATTLYENGADLRSIQAILGHESLATTQKYTQVTTAHLQAVMNRCHPANAKRLESKGEEING